MDREVSRGLQSGLVFSAIFVMTLELILNKLYFGKFFLDNFAIGLIYLCLIFNLLLRIKKKKRGKKS